jgi:hypothetical protein
MRYEYSAGGSTLGAMGTLSHPVNRKPQTIAVDNRCMSCFIFESRLAEERGKNVKSKVYRSDFAQVPRIEIKRTALL